MAKQGTIPFMNDFKVWLQQQIFKNPNSRDCIISRILKLNERELAHIHTGKFKKNKKTQIELSVWDILTSMFAQTKGPKLSYVEEFMLALISRCNVDKKSIASTYNLSIGTVENYISALWGYKDFILDKTAPIGRNSKLTPDENATIANIVGDKIVLTGNQLIPIFASRMGTQDRCSGNKVFLPLGLIGKIIKEHKGTKIKKIRDWSLEEAKKVLIHTEHNTIPVSKIKEIIIDTNTSDTFITVPDNEILQRVFNPLENGAINKTPMMVKRISQTDIDHVIDIDTILTNLGPTLDGLKVLKDWIITAQAQLNYSKIETKKLDVIYRQIMAWPQINKLITPKLINQIEHDLNAISQAETLQLAEDNWNRSTKKQANSNHSSKK